MNKALKWGLVTCGIVAIVAGGIWYQQPKVNDEIAGPAGAGSPEGGARERKALNVNGLILRPQLLTDEYVTTGLILPDEEVSLSFETSGKIVDISFTEGTSVRKGQLLARGINFAYLTIPSRLQSTNFVSKA